jgi:hypothetical protein
MVIIFYKACMYYGRSSLSCTPHVLFCLLPLTSHPTRLTFLTALSVISAVNIMNKCQLQQRHCLADGVRASQKLQHYKYKNRPCKRATELAQLEERPAFNRVVVGSSPIFGVSFAFSVPLMPLLPYVRRAWVFSLFLALLSHLFFEFCHAPSPFFKK